MFEGLWFAWYRIGLKWVIRSTVWSQYVWKVLEARLQFCPHNVTWKYDTYYQSTSNARRSVLLHRALLVVRVDFLLANFPDILGLGGLSVRCWGRVFGMRKWGRKFLVICGRLEKLFRLRILQIEPIFIFCICTLLSTADPALRMFVGCYHKSDAVRGEFPCDPVGLGVIWKGEEFCILLSWQIYWWIFLLCL